MMSERISKHKCNEKNREREHATALNTHIWKLKDKGESYNIKFTRIRQAPSYRAGLAVYLLCVGEAQCILTKNLHNKFNSRNNILST